MLQQRQSISALQNNSVFPPIKKEVRSIAMTKLLVVILMLACVATVYGQGPKVIMSLCDMPANGKLDDGCKANCKNYSSTSLCLYVPELEASFFMFCVKFPKCAQGRYYVGSDCQASSTNGEFRTPCSCFSNHTVDCQPTRAIAKRCPDATCRSNCSTVVTAPLNKCANYADRGQKMSVNVKSYAPCDYISFVQFSDRSCIENRSSPMYVPTNICAWEMRHGAKSYSVRFRCESGF